jgi:hypothetical protein
MIIPRNQSTEADPKPTQQRAAAPVQRMQIKTTNQIKRHAQGTKFMWQCRVG